MRADIYCSGSPKKLAPTELGVNKIGECAKVMPIIPDRTDALTPRAPHQQRYMKLLHKNI